MRINHAKLLQNFGFGKTAEIACEILAKADGMEGEESTVEPIVNAINANLSEKDKTTVMEFYGVLGSSMSLTDALGRFVDDLCEIVEE